MNVLIDTEVLIWVQSKPTALSTVSQQHLADPLTTKWVGEVSLFEIAIKQKVGKLHQFETTLSAYIQQLQEDGFVLLPIDNQHIVAYDRIPFFEDHRDPFDRLILATALHEGWPVMSADPKFTRYKDQVEIIW